MLFIDYSSAFNTIVPSKLILKLEALELNPALCNWILDFLKVGNNTCTSLILNTGAPQSPSVLPVHPKLRGQTRLQLNQVCR